MQEVCVGSEVRACINRAAGGFKTKTTIMGKRVVTEEVLMSIANIQVTSKTSLQSKIEKSVEGRGVKSLYNEAFGCAEI